MTRKELWEMVRQHPRWGPLIKDETYRDARAEAFAGFPAWRQPGRPGALK